MNNSEKSKGGKSETSCTPNIFGVAMKYRWSISEVRTPGVTLFPPWFHLIAYENLTSQAHVFDAYITMSWTTINSQT